MSRTLDFRSPICVLEIGAVPILQLAESYPDMAATPGVLNEILDGLVPEVSAQVLDQWEFPEMFAAAARDQSNRFREHAGEHDYSDVIIVAHLHSLVRQREFHKLPRLDDTAEPQNRREKRMPFVVMLIWSSSRCHTKPTLDSLPSSLPKYHVRDICHPLA